MSIILPTLTELEVIHSIMTLFLHCVKSSQKRPADTGQREECVTSTNEVTLKCMFLYEMVFFVCFFYHGAIEVTRCFVPGLRVSIFTHTYVVHQSVAVDKTFA